MRFRQRQGRRSSTRAYQERLKTLNAADFGDLLLETIRLFREQPGRARATIRSASATCWSTSIRTPTSRNISGCGCWRRQRAQHLLRRRRRPVDLWLARRRGRQHPALREGFSRRQGDPAGAQLPLDRPHPRRRLGPDRAQRRPARQDAVHRGDATARRSTVAGVWDAEEEARAVGEEIEQLQRARPCARRDRDPGARLVPDARVRRPLRHARPALPRDRRPALLRARRKSATRSPICALIDQPADDLAFERIVNVPKRGLGDATVQAAARIARARGACR